MEENQSWQCPYCGHHQVLLEKGNYNDNLKSTTAGVVQISKYSQIGLFTVSIACLNLDCKKLTLTVGLKKRVSSQIGSYSPSLQGEPIEKWSLLPASIAKPQPDYIPAPIKKDYEEACKIANLSPNASAVLSRRCLESMIKNFCEIKENSLYQSIEKLNSKLENNQAPKGVTEETIEAIDSIRRMGRIGAHMKEPTGMLVDIDPEEAILLVELIEMLFKEWYVARNDRQERLNKIKQTTIQKEQKRNSGTKRKETEASH